MPQAVATPISPTSALQRSPWQRMRPNPASTNSGGMRSSSSSVSVEKRPDGNPPDIPLQANGVLPPSDTIGRAAAGIGFVNVRPDIDYATRTEMMAIQFGKDFYPPLSVVTAGLYLGQTPDQFSLQPGSSLAAGRIKIGDRSVPVNSLALSLVNFYGPRETIPTYSMADVVAGRVQPDDYARFQSFARRVDTALHKDVSVTLGR